ncbi:MAG TPA: MoaD/ThiS family protein [Myxococcota bacterium]|nr:MoaD/ThiS family protein [Myxococcota bacterium]
MARVVFAPGLRRFTGGAESAEIAARDVRELLRALYQRWPELERRLAEGTAIALDGEVIPSGEALLEPLRPDTEVHFLPQIGGG